MLRALVFLLAIAAIALAALQLRRSNAKAREREQRQARRVARDEAWQQMIEVRSPGPAEDCDDERAG